MKVTRTNDKITHIHLTDSEVEKLLCEAIEAKLGESLEDFESSSLDEAAVSLHFTADTLKTTEQEVEV